jgi:hypothetical protein
VETHKHIRIQNSSHLTRRHQTEKKAFFKANTLAYCVLVTVMTKTVLKQRHQLKLFCQEGLRFKPFFMLNRGQCYKLFTAVIYERRKVSSVGHCNSPTLGSVRFHHGLVFYSRKLRL